MTSLGYLCLRLQGFSPGCLIKVNQSQEINVFLHLERQFDLNQETYWLGIQHGKEASYLIYIQLFYYATGDLNHIMMLAGSALGVKQLF